MEFKTETLEEELSIYRVELDMQIDEMLRLQHQYEQKLHLHRTITDSLPLAVFVVNQDNEIVYKNGQACSLIDETSVKSTKFEHLLSGKSRMLMAASLKNLARQSSKELSIPLVFTLDEDTEHTTRIVCFQDLAETPNNHFLLTIHL